MNIKDALALAKRELNNVPDRDVDAAWIVCSVMGVSRSALHFEGERELTKKQEEALLNIVERRKKREPLQYIFGFVPFYNVELKTDSRALIPRDETAILVEKALEFINEKQYNTVLDIGTGSGAIAVSVKKNASVSVTASDISEQALSLARENAEKNKCEIEFIKSDLFENISKKFDVILSNPPYIPTKDIERLERELSFEPQNALDGGSDGLDFYRDIIFEAKRHLNKGGLLMLEIGFDQGDAVKALLAKNGFTESVVLKDYSGLDRIAYTFYEG
ncbi:MAG: peptide chain release factor N(5)-glutamine methyltransferase [Clostridia bacterium]|nr:peptide chain release factor N(5)-glutamine methyltransferase [Clostridia bacterium]